MPPQASHLPSAPASAESEGGALALARSPERLEAVKHYMPVIMALLDQGLPVAYQKPLSKRPAFGTVRASLVDPSITPDQLLHEITSHGWNLGMVTHLESLPGRNPLGVEILDIDSADHGLDLALFKGLMTKRRGEDTL